jgi:hypothetical protein
MIGPTTPRLVAIVEPPDDAIIAKNSSGVAFAWNWAAERGCSGLGDDRSATEHHHSRRPNGGGDVHPRGESRGERVEHYETTRRCNAAMALCSCTAGDYGPTIFRFTVRGAGGRPTVAPDSENVLLTLHLIWINAGLPDPMKGWRMMFGPVVWPRPWGIRHGRGQTADDSRCR